MNKEQKAAKLKGCEDRLDCWRVKAADKSGYARGRKIGLIRKANKEEQMDDHNEITRFAAGTS